VLGIAAGASAKELAKAYRKLALRQFPDRMSVRESSELEQARQAYELLLVATEETPAELRRRGDDDDDSGVARLLVRRRRGEEASREQQPCLADAAAAGDAGAGVPTALSDFVRGPLPFPRIEWWTVLTALEICVALPALIVTGPWLLGHVVLMSLGTD
jgi:curved DNA-binding protein CbpA